ncbi:hypothetical protein DXB65_09300 [Bacteroides oleiciplenus]|uniref:Uncharacterized protein n=1 Tax=Bacteroides oleiciplenus TaxID=626931 RepID=A0A3E5BG63_9BACE|nr:hypothetical protein DXB65_09300 [Bacteroides oleiciplenus]
MFFILIYFKLVLFQKVFIIPLKYQHEQFIKIQIIKKYSNDIFLEILKKLKKCFSIFIVIF